MIDIKMIYYKNKHHIQNPDVLFAISPITHGLDLPVFEPDGNMECSSQSEHNDMTVLTWVNAYKWEEHNQPITLTQAELNDLTQDLNLSLEPAQLPGSRLKEKRLLVPETTFYRYEDRDWEIRQLFTFQNN